MAKQNGDRQFTYQIPDRSEIIRYVLEHGEPVAFKRLAKELGMELPGERDAIRYRLRAMVRDGELVSDRRNRYAIADRRTETLTGRVEATLEGYGFVLIEGLEDDIYLNKRQMSAVTHGDEVRIRLVGEDRRGRPQGEVVEVVTHATRQVIGRLYFERQLGFVEPMNPKIQHRYLASGLPQEKHDGQVVILSVTEHPTQHKLPAGDIVDVLGDHLTPALEVEVAIRNHDLPAEWPDQVLADSDRVPVKIPNSQISQRVDLRALPFVTIDGEDARDFDDAVYCETRTRGGYRLLVAIADVAHYVHPESALDQEAARRGTSVYFPGHVIPMLPEVLSNGLCSLRPDEDRLALVCDMTISQTGKLSGYHFSEAVIRSRARLTYTQVAGLLSGQSPLDMPHFDTRDADLNRLYSLYKLLLDARGRRGALEFDSTDIDFRYDDQGHITTIEPSVRNDAHRIIEECMLCANVAAARLLSRQERPALYRVHEPPDVDRCEQLRIFLARFGIHLAVGEEPQPSDFQRAIDAVSRLKNSQVLQTVILRTMNQAVYQSNNRGHFGLNYTRYAHFTSPIRRYPDLLLHRLIKSLLVSNDD
ncbi:MAG: ribonuclease R, partial [Pseudomonadota bacterium]